MFEIIIMLVILTSPFWGLLIACKLYATARGTTMTGIGREREIKRRQNAMRRGMTDGQLNAEAWRRMNGG